ncbi:MAG: hypothetical protein ACO1OG_01270 [Devosia sp.]
MGTVDLTSRERIEAAATILATLIVFALCVGLSWFRTLPAITADEIGYLGIARFLAGNEAPNMAGSAYYYPGYSFLLAPIDWLFRDYAAIYRAAGVLNAAFTAAAIPLLLQLRRDLSAPDSWLWLPAALVVTVWPTHFTFVFMPGLPENSLRFFFLLFAVMAFSVVRRGSWGTAICLAATAALLALMHPRFIAMGGLAAVFLLHQTIIRRIGIGSFLAALAVIVVGFMVTRELNTIFSEALWGKRPGNPAAQYFRTIFASPEAVFAYARRLAGHAWYQAAASFGLIPLGLVAWGVTVLRKDRPDSWPVLVLLAASVALVWAAGAAQLYDATRLDHLIYGRYLDAVTPVLLWSGVLALLTARENPVLRYSALPILVVTLAGGAFAARYGNSGGATNLANVSGIWPILGSGKNSIAELFLPAVSISGTVAIMLYMLASFRSQLALALLVLYATYGVWFIHRELLKVEPNRQTASLEPAQIYERLPEGQPIYIDASARGGRHFIHQWVAGRRFTSVNLSDTQLDPGSYVLVGEALVAPPVSCVVAEMPDNSRLLKLLAEPNAAAACPSA